MRKELKEAIINFILANPNEFQLHNATTSNFREYIFTSKGDYLIGGEDVSDFITKAIALLK